MALGKQLMESGGGGHGVVVGGAGVGGAGGRVTEGGSE